jgi:ABC-type uncharacterized transport system permease subunit
MSGNLLWVPVAVYLVAWLAEFGVQWSRPPRGAPFLRSVLAVGWGAHTFLLAASLMRAGPSLAALLNGTGWITMIGYYGVWRSGRLRPLGQVLLPLAIALLLSSILTAEEGLVRAAPLGTEWLWRNLLIAHIVALLAGHLLFAMACLSSIAYLVQERQIKTKARPLSARWPALGTMETLTHRSVGLGFLFLTIGILLGLAVSGAENLRTRLLEWRLVIPVASWIVYAGFLLVYDYRGRRGRFSAVWSIVGFVFVLASLVFEMAVLATGAR